MGLFSIRRRIFLRGQGSMSRAHVRETDERDGSEVDGAWVCQVRMGREAGRRMAMQSLAPPEHASICLSDVCAGSLAQDSEMNVYKSFSSRGAGGMGGDQGNEIDPNPNDQQSKIRQWELVLK